MLCRELFEMGVRCFDIDIVITSDQQLLVAHPKALQVTLTVQSACVLFDHRFESALTALCCFLQDALQQDTVSRQRPLDIHSYSLQDLRLAGGNSSAFPTAAEVQIC